MEKIRTECGKCHIVFPSIELTVLHLNQVHGKRGRDAEWGSRTTLIMDIKEEGWPDPTPSQYMPMINTMDAGTPPVTDPLWGMVLQDDDFMFGDCSSLPAITNGQATVQHNPNYAATAGPSHCPPLPTLPLPTLPCPTAALATGCAPSTSGASSAMPGVPRIRCTYCPKHYSSIYGLREHVKGAHQNFTITCQLCGRMYKYGSGYSRHKREHHPEIRCQTHRP